MIARSLKGLLIILTCYYLFGCTLRSHRYGKAPSSKEFNYIKYDGSFKMEVKEFYQDTVLCGKAITYALMIGKPLNKGLPRKLTVLLTCDYKNYRVGDTLTITTAAQNSVYIKAPHNLMYIVRRKKINGEDYVRIIGDENPAILGSVMTD